MIKTKEEIMTINNKDDGLYWNIPLKRVDENSFEYESIVRVSSDPRTWDQKVSLTESGMEKRGERVNNQLNVLKTDWQNWPIEEPF